MPPDPQSNSDLDRDVDASMRMFEKSKVGEAAAIARIQPARVMLVLDGSPQDETSKEAASYLRETFNVETLVLDARDGQHDDDLAVAAAQNVSGSRPIARGDGDSYDAILAAIKTHSVDVLIVPCPFGRDFEHIGTDSAGTVIDVLLSRCPCPILIMRRGDQHLSECVANVSMVVGGECDVETKAAAWVFGLASAGATVTLNLVIEKEQFENIRSIIEALSPDATIDSQQFSDALTKTHQAIHGAMAKTAAADGLRYHLLPQAGEAAPPNPLSESKKMLIVMPLEVDDRFGQGFVQDRIRRSPHPVLVVPGHVAG
tara:strand:+ start:443236 stop:444180 length:945 start_codon:yes stop_codon:yes gene_type:complete